MGRSSRSRWLTCLCGWHCNCTNATRLEYCCQTGSAASSCQVGFGFVFLAARQCAVCLPGRLTSSAGEQLWELRCFAAQRLLTNDVYVAETLAVCTCA